MYESSFGFEIHVFILIRGWTFDARNVLLMTALGMGGVSDNTEKTDTLVTDSDAQCTPIGSVSLITEISNKLTPTSLEH